MHCSVLMLYPLLCSLTLRLNIRERLVCGQAGQFLHVTNPTEMNQHTKETWEKYFHSKIQLLWFRAVLVRNSQHVVWPIDGPLMTWSQLSFSFSWIFPTYSEAKAGVSSRLRGRPRAAAMPFDSFLSSHSTTFVTLAVDTGSAFQNVVGFLFVAASSSTGLDSVTRLCCGRHSG